MKTTDVPNIRRIHETRMIRAILSLLLLAAAPPAAFSIAPEAITANRVVSDSVVTPPASDSAQAKSRAVFFAVNYGNNSSFLGRYQAEVLPYYSADISYMSKTGFWLSLMTYEINNSATFIDEVDLIAGWNMNLSRRLDASVYYTRYFFTGSTELIKASVANTGTVSLGADWGFIYSKVSANYIFGGASDFFIVIDNSRYMEVPRIFSKNDYLSFEPKISIISGTQTFVDTHYINQGTPLFIPTGGGPSSGRRPGSGSGPAPTAESSETIYNILSYEFSLPIAYNTGNFSFEINGRYSIPVNLLEGDPSVPQFFFTGGLVYYISSK